MLTYTNLQQTLLFYIEPFDEKKAAILWHRVVETVKSHLSPNEKMLDVAFSPLNKEKYNGLLTERGEQLLPMENPTQKKTVRRWPWQQ